MSLTLILSAVGLLAVSGIPGLLMSRRSGRGQWIATALAIGGSIVGAIGAIAALANGQDARATVAWGLPIGRFSVAVDAISVVFMLPVFVVAALGSIYGLSYWRQKEHPENGRKLRLFYGLLAGALAMVTIARDAVLFLMAWEVMALSAFALVTTEDENEDGRWGGWVYLVATHAATLVLIAMFAMLRRATGSFDIGAIAASAISPAMSAVIFALTVVGFGLKAGIVPLHVWLPGAHANAPSHVSAIMSGVLIKMGVYGIVRISGILPHANVWWGAALLAIGGVSGLLGIVFAMAQSDIKKLLAYCSIENVGIIMLGLGVAMIGRATGRNELLVLGLAGALLHVWNHGLFKSLLFFGAGSVIHAAHTRDMNVLGGLAKRMPKTAVLFTIGSVAICGLPPLNGFVSELLIYLGLLKTVTGAHGGATWLCGAMAAPVLAMMGALAVAAFVKLIGIVFLGEPRTEAATHAHEPSRSMLAPMAVVAGFCLLIGLVPIAVAPVLGRAIEAWQSGRSAGPPGARLAELADWAAVLRTLHWITGTNLALAALLVGGFVALKKWIGRGEIEMTGTWGCGYVAPTARMQYTGTSFAQVLVGLFGGLLRPWRRRPKIHGVFPAKSEYESRIHDTVLDGVMLPGFSWLERLLTPLRMLQQGRVQLYLMYILIIIVVLMWL